MAREFSLSGSDWMLTHSLPSEYSPGASDFIRTLSRGGSYGPDWVRAVVPGDVQSDMTDAGEIAPIEYGFNSRLAEWTYQRDWTYVKYFDSPDMHDYDKSVFLKFDGVDYECDVFLNGNWLGRHIGAWNPFEFDVTGSLRNDMRNALIVQVRRAPDEEGQFGRTSKVRTLKARFAYGWDWCTRIIPLGIIGDVSLVYKPASYIDEVYATAAVDWRNGKAAVTFNISLLAGRDCPGLILEAGLSIGGEMKGRSSERTDGSAPVILTVEISNAELWQPNGYGDQPLYEAEAVLLDLEGHVMDHRTFNYGIRDISWEQNDNAGEGALPYVMSVNGKRIFMRGFNWTPARQLYGRSLREIYERRLDLVRRANVTVLRVWGSGIGEKEVFYDLCDKYGILVIQELFQSSGAEDNYPSVKDEFISLLCDVAGGFMKRVRNHASIAVWCGGNELCVRGGAVDIHGKILKPEFYGWENYRIKIPGSDPLLPLAGDYPTLVALKMTVDSIAPDRRWLPTSASGPRENASLDYKGLMHDVHGPWTNIGPTGHYAFYNGVDMMLHSEFGCDGAGSIRTMAEYLPEGKAWPPDATNTHAWNRGRMWINGNRTRTEKYFGKIDDMELYVRASQYVQAESLRYAVEAHRRRSWRCSGALIWHFGEPWPNMCDTCCVDFDNIPKPAYYAVSRANSPVHISAAYETVAWGGRENFEAEIFAINSTGIPFIAEIEVKIMTAGGVLLYCSEFEKNLHDEVADLNMNISIPIENINEDIFILKCRISDTIERGTVLSESWSLHSTLSEDPYGPLTNLEPGSVSITGTAGHDGVNICNTGSNAMPGLWLESDDDGGVFYSDNWLCLMPGESKEVHISGGRGKIEISAWNLKNTVFKLEKFERKHVI